MTIQIDLSGRTALVVGGGGGGIGTAMCERLAEAGAGVVAFTDRADHLDDTIARIGDLGGTVTGAVIDVRDADALGAAVDRSGAEHGPFDLVVNVVGGARFPDWYRALDLPVESFDDIVATNLRYVLVVCQRVARHLVAAGRPGAMVNVSSIASRSAPLIASYGASKAGLDALTRTLSVEWGRYGIRVNAVAPGTINTPRSGRTDLVDEAARFIPLGRRGHPRDIADATVFLLSDLAAYVTGQVLVVDGGASHRGAGLDDHDLPVFVTNPAIRERFEGPPS